MTKNQIKVFEELLGSDTFEGKKMLRYLLWRNTTRPKYNPGDLFEVTKPGERVFGYPVKDLKAKVIKSYSFKEDQVWRYELESIVRCGDREIVSKHFASELELKAAKRCDDNVNVLGEPKSDAPQSMDL